MSGKVRQRFKSGGGSYLAAHDPREVLGLGAASKLDWVEVVWPMPSQRHERFEGLEIDRYTTVIEGAGKVVS